MRKPQRLLQACLIYGVSSLFVGYQFIIQGSVGVMSQELMGGLQLDCLELGLLSCSFFYSYVLLQIPAGIAVDRYGPRRVLTCSLCLLSLSCLLFSQSTTLIEATLARVLAGVACAPGIVCTLYLGRRWFVSRLFPLLLGIMEMSCMGGGAAGDYLIPCLLDNGNWQHVMVLLSGVSLILLTLVWLFVRDTPVGHQSIDTHQTLCLGPVLTCRAVWIAGIISGLMYAIISAFAALWCIPFLMQAYPESGHYPAFGTGLIFLGAALGAPACGALASHIGKSRPVIMGSAVASGLLMVLALFWFSAQWQTSSLLLLLGLASGGYILPFALAHGHISDKNQGVANGVLNMVSNALGTIALQPLIGWHLGLSGHSPVLADFQLSLVLLVLCPVLALFLVLNFKESSDAEAGEYTVSSSVPHT